MPAHPNAAAIERFYRAFDARDAETMNALYAPGATFSDPAFGTLDGDEVRAMWTMLTRQATDLSVIASDVRADGDSGSAHWRAAYTFTATGRPVVNEIDATFRFDAQGRIVEHRDRFSLWRWARQALGPAGLLLGSNPVGQALLRRRARARLAAFMRR
ncbi:MAG TPA: nuclear transport factor 2 family protein [Solirubrobacteraceae bacterium]|jgi:ketosteroid isomerase-like protein|nr:nuclear transport factor 2 family protein [Solirubrobacteraceae bacterium]